MVSTRLLSAIITLSVVYRRMKPNVVARRASSHIEASTQAVVPHAMQRPCHNERIAEKVQNLPIDDGFVIYSSKQLLFVMAKGRFALNKN
jgi:hypothetical protein